MFLAAGGRPWSSTRRGSRDERGADTIDPGEGCGVRATTVADRRSRSRRTATVQGGRLNREIATFAAAGDVQLGDSAICPGFGVASRIGRHGADRLFAGIVQQLSADLTIVNLETMLSSAGLEDADWASMQMRGHREYAGTLARVGVTVASVANNHALQHGREAFADTVSALEEAGIGVCGVRGTAPWTSRPLGLEVRGLSIGILGYSLRPRQYSDEEPPYAEGNRSGMIADIRRLSGRGQHVVLSLHWGEEFVDRPSMAEVDLGHELIQAGASLIVGHHPHVLRPVESYRGGVIAYSLGNLVSDMVWYDPLRTGGILKGELRASGGIANLELVRTRIGDDFTPRMVDGVDDLGSETPGGLDAESYSRAVSETVSAQRRGAYAYALRNLHRYPGRLLVQLARRTARNKLMALAGRS